MTNCKNCGKKIYKHNKSGYCYICGNRILQLKYREERKLKRVLNKKKGLCTLCSKPVKPIIVIPQRCNKCSKRKK